MAGLREALEEKFDEIDAGDVPEPTAGVVETAPEPTEPEPAVETRARDEEGKFTKTSTKPAPRGPPAPPVAGQGEVADPAAPVAASATSPAFKAPQSWKPHIRELASKLPPEFHPILEESLRRDKEIAQALQTSAEKAKGAEPWAEAIRPYEAQIRATGQQPHQYVGQLLQTAHALTYGHNKAAVLADIVMQFQVPPEALDKALVARLQGGTRQAAPTQQQFADPRVDKLLATLQQQQEAQTAAQTTEAESAVQQFAEANEFFGDVGETVADILDSWKARGKTEITEADLQKAYNIACNLDENVSTVLSKRKAVASAGTVQAATQRAKLASSSVKSQPTAAPAAQPTGRRAALEAAFDELNG